MVVRIGMSVMVSKARESWQFVTQLAASDISPDNNDDAKHWHLFLRP